MVTLGEFLHNKEFTYRKYISNGLEDVKVWSEFPMVIRFTPEYSQEFQIFYKDGAIDSTTTFRGLVTILKRSNNKLYAEIVEKYPEELI